METVPLVLFALAGMTLLVALSLIGIHAFGLYRVSQAGTRLQDRRVLWLWVAAFFGLMLGPFALLSQPAVGVAALWLRRQLPEPLAETDRWALQTVTWATAVATVGLWTIGAGALWYTMGGFGG